MKIRTCLAGIASAALVVASPLPASAEESDVSDVQDGDLTSEQRQSINNTSVSNTEAITTGDSQFGPLSGRTTSFYRGSWLMWTEDNAWFTYNGSRVTDIDPWQERGWIFPNMAWNDGWTHYYNTAFDDRLRFTDTIGAGTVTPWGDVSVYKVSFTHHVQLTGDGGSSWWE